MENDSEVIIRVENLESGYGKNHILFGVNCVARRGEITLILGPNGSGKSTVLKSIFGMCDIKAGSITYNGTSITGLMPHQVSRQGITYMPQTQNVFSALNVRENLSMAAYSIDSASKSKRQQEVLETFPMLKDHMNSKVTSLSGGQRQMLAMAIALMRKPKVMLFDEPTANLSPKLATEVLDKIAHLRDELGITIILVEQNVRRALTLGNHVFLLVSGKLVFDGKSEDLLKQPDLGKMYLGFGDEKN